MRLSVSNIGWTPEQDNQVYAMMKKYDFTGLEIAPTRIFPEQPYEKIKEAQEWKEKISSEYGFTVPSMQSIWFGRQESIFGSEYERQLLMDYTKKAIAFAVSIDCRNLVFGCPKNRNIPKEADPEIAIPFFKESGDYAADMGTVIGLEANPPIYNTNYINDTSSAFELIERVNSDGFMLNLDVGTMIQNREDISELAGKVHLINHVHISEPGLKPIEKRTVHADLKSVLTDGGYRGFISIEMGRVDNLQVLESRMNYVRSIFE